MFETLLSNKNMKEELSHAALQGKPLHAYMFCGAEGSGKHTAAVAFAAEIVGGDKSKAYRGTHPDIIFFEPESGKKSIPVKAVRDMRQDAFVTPTEGTRKVYIINGDALGESGQNALLTVLEQPPSFSVFIILCEAREKMLSTVISRCSVYDMEYVDENDGARYLKKDFPDLTDDTLKTYMRAAQGNVGFAKKIAGDSEYAELVKMCEAVALCVANGDKYGVLARVNKLQKEKLRQFLQVLTIYFRDIAVKNTADDDSMLVFCASILKNSGVFAKIEADTAYRCVNACTDALSAIDGNISQSLVVCDLVIHFFGGKTLD